MESSRFISKQLTVARVAGLLSAVTGIFVLVGWALGIPWIKSVLPGAVEMKVNTAVCLLVAGFALCLLDAPSSRRSKQLGQWLALFVAAIGFATLAEYVFGWNLGIDELLFEDNTDAYNPTLIPEPRTTLLTTLGILFLLRRRRH